MTKTVQTNEAAALSIGVNSHAHLARTDANRQKAEKFHKQIIELNAKVTGTSVLVTLGDVLFENKKTELKRGSGSRLAKLVDFFNAYPGCTAVIEGYTDNLGSETFNFGLSLGRANSVKCYLVSQGIALGRLAAAGNGECSPIAGNGSASGRKLNRRVEVIITNIA